LGYDLRIRSIVDGKEPPTMDKVNEKRFEWDGIEK